jgi:RNA polymerase sigma factor (sigma-70 family)
VEANLGLARMWSERFWKWTGLDPDDLYQEAVSSLMKAAEGFDPDRGFKFSTYASRAIIHRLRSLQREALQPHEQRLGEFEAVIADHRPTACRGALADHGVNFSILKPRTAFILVNRFGLYGVQPKTLEAIGEIIGLKKERVRQIVEDGLAQLRENHEANARLAMRARRIAS